MSLVKRKLRTYMKVSIFTFWREENYGAILQATALQDACTKLGADVNLIAFDITHERRPLPRRLLSALWLKIRRILGFRKRQQRSQAFRKKWIKSSPLLKNEEDLLEYLSSREICIVGSDQVWNPQIVPPNSNPFFLENVTSKKIAYAASFGIQELGNALNDIYSRKIQNFHMISTRERTGLSILKSLGISSAELVLDPTFLLSKKEWEKKSSKRIKKADYILCYIMPGKKEVREIYEIAQFISSFLKIPKIIYLGDREYTRFLYSGARVDAGPSEFLRYFLDATYVVTNSFHGTCFSVNFQKNFFSIIDSSSKSENRNSRIIDLLTLLGLDNRLIRGNPDFEKLKITAGENVDYKKIEKILIDFRKKSLNFLTSALTQ